MIGLLIAFSIISVWISHLLYCLMYVLPSENVFLTTIHSLVQAYLFTGLFITAHDAMHGTVSTNKFINKSVGILASFLFAGLSYKRLLSSHSLHHHHPTDSEKDPDFHQSNNYFIWFVTFMVRYTTISQLVIMAITFNVLMIWFQKDSIVIFWVIPSLLGTLQLFTFGTYFPHKKPHTTTMQPHFARSLKKNHLVAMLSCYFFGYHSEHHQYPHIPWWKLYSVKK